MIYLSGGTVSLTVGVSLTLKRINAAGGTVSLPFFDSVPLTAFLDAVILSFWQE